MYPATVDYNRISSTLLKTLISGQKTLFLLKFTKKILRKLDKPRAKKKDERYAIDSMNLLLTGLYSMRYNSHIILISDGSIDWTPMETNLKQFIEIGGSVAMLHSGSRENEWNVKTEF
ncbi:MAG: hypothetical protein ACJA1A_003893 [Saprospiraceae bacterium]